MKKFVSLALVAFALLFSVTASAQFRWSAVAGVAGNSLHFKQDLVSTSSSIGYLAGINGEMMFPGIGLGLDLGLRYNQQGGKVNLGERLIWSSQGYGNEQVYIHSVNIPVHLRFKYTRLNGLEDLIAPFVFGGPEFNIQVAHGHCDAFKYSGGDLSLTVGGGAEIKKVWQIYGGYTWGMTYALRTQLLDNFSARNRQWYIRLAYFF